jgi:hypothetical protein
VTVCSIQTWGTNKQITMAYNTNDVTGAFLASKAATNSYRDGWDRIFSKTKQKESVTDAQQLEIQQRIQAMRTPELIKASLPTLRAEADSIERGTQHPEFDVMCTGDAMIQVWQLRALADELERRYSNMESNI